MASVTAGLSGTLALVRGEAGWEDRLPMDAGAVFGSFWAVPLSLPAVVLASEAARRAVLASPDAAAMLAEARPGVIAASAVLGALLSWGASLFLLTRLAARSGAGWRVSPLIVAYNWSRLLANLVLGAIAALAVATGAWAIMLLAGVVKAILVLWLDVQVVRGALALTAGQAVGAVAMVLLARLVATWFGSVLLGPLTGGAGLG